MNENQARTSTPNRRGKTTNHDDQTGPEYEKVIANDNYSVCSDISRVSRRRKNRNDEKSVSIRTPKEPSTTEHRDDGVIKVDLDDDSRHWPKETETFATSECTSGLISLAVRLGILLVASLVLFWRSNRLKLPQINLYRVGLNCLTISITAVYWIFYSYKVLHWNNYSYRPIVEYSSQYVNILIFIHYLTIILLYLKAKEKIYLLEVVRTTDGFHKFYNLGDVSIQSAAAEILQNYYLDFPLYNPALQKSSKPRVKTLSSFKNYDIDGPNNDGASVAEKNRAILAAAARRRDAGHNERYYDEVEHERRVRKRLARLSEAAEDSFSHIKRQLRSDSNMPGAQSSLDPIETAHAVFPAMARSMQKYLRTTRQHQHFTMDDIIDHLAFCIRHEMSSSAFLQRYTQKRPSSSYPGKLIESVDWSISCDEPLITHLRPGVVFSLNQLDYSLVVTCRTAPKIELREEFIDPASHRFVIRMDGSETSV